MKKYRKVKIIYRIILSLLLTFIVLIITICFIIHGYINKINLVPTSDTSLSAIDSEVDQPVNYEDFIVSNEEIISELSEPENNTKVPDSPAEDIQLIEDEIRRNMEQKSTPIMEDRDVFNVLFIGSDTRKPGNYGNSDSMILISIFDLLAFNGVIPNVLLNERM
jgi:hypothetical protein